METAQHSQKASIVFTAPVIYTQPGLDELKRKFPAHVDTVYAWAPLGSIEGCGGVSREDREVSFEYVHMSRNASTLDVLVEMSCRGLRPALYEELLGFSAEYPDEQQKHPIAALGSMSHAGTRPRAAFLWSDDRGQELHLSLFDRDWDDDYRFLAVRE